MGDELEGLNDLFQLIGRSETGPEFGWRPGLAQQNALIESSFHLQSDMLDPDWRPLRLANITLLHHGFTGLHQPGVGGDDLYDLAFSLRNLDTTRTWRYFPNNLQFGL